MRCTIGLGEWGSGIAWREEKESKRRRNLYGGEGEKDVKSKNRWQIVQPRKYGGRVPYALVGKDAIDRKYVACSGS